MGTLKLRSFRFFFVLSFSQPRFEFGGVSKYLDRFNFALKKSAPEGNFGTKVSSVRCPVLLLGLGTWATI